NSHSFSDALLHVAPPTGRIIFLVNGGKIATLSEAPSKVFNSQTDSSITILFYYLYIHFSQGVLLHSLTECVDTKNAYANPEGDRSASGRNSWQPCKQQIHRRELQIFLSKSDDEWGC